MMRKIGESPPVLVFFFLSLSPLDPIRGSTNLDRLIYTSPVYKIMSHTGLGNCLHLLKKNKRRSTDAFGFAFFFLFLFFLRIRYFFPPPILTKSITGILLTLFIRKMIRNCSLKKAPHGYIIPGQPPAPLTPADPNADARSVRCSLR